MVRYYIHGLHEPGGEHLMASHPGFLLFTHELGHDPGDHNGFDYTPWTSQGFVIIARLNHGYGRAGTIPELPFYAGFARRVENFVANSAGCSRWIIGNEPNHSQERPNGQLIYPWQYGECFNLCASSILSIEGHHSKDIVIPAPVAVWNVETTYPQNPSGDWLTYYTDLLSHCDRSLIGGIAFHTYAHGADPALITSEQTMDYPYEDRRYHFRAYQDFMEATPEHLWKLPFYITETNQNGPWLDQNNGWIQAAMTEVDRWNRAATGQIIHACICYRWPKYDQWHIDGVTGAEQDFQAAASLGFYVDIEDDGGDEMPEPKEVLKDGGMEGPYEAQTGPHGHPLNTIVRPKNWTAYWLDHMPEFKEAKRSEYPDRVYSGNSAAQWFANYARPNGGLYQTVTTEPGKRYRLSGRGQLWCVYKNGNDVPASLETRVSLYGSTDVDDSRNLRSLPIHPHNRWLPFNALEFMARSDLTTVFILGIFIDPGQDMNAYVDSFSLVCLDHDDDSDDDAPPQLPIESPEGGESCDPISSGAAGLAMATAQSLLAFAEAATKSAEFFQELLSVWLPEPKLTIYQRITKFFTRD